MHDSVPISPTTKELLAFKLQIKSWLTANRPENPGFLLPLSFLEVGEQQQVDFLREWQYQVWRAGYLGMSWPKKYGGMGVSPQYQQIVDEEMYEQKTPIIFNTIGLGWAGPLINDLGTEEEKQKYLKPILSADDIWCQGFSEPNHGSDLANIQTSATRDGENYIINGSKIWTTLGNYADHMILLARTNPNTEKKYSGLSFFLMPMKVDGVTTRPIKKLSGEYGFTEVFFNRVKIPSTHLMGQEGQGWRLAIQTLQYERGAQAGSAGGVSITKITTADLIGMAQQINQGGKPILDNPIIADQIMQFQIEEKALQLHHARQNIVELTTDYPMSLPLSNKLQTTELNRRIRQFAVKLQSAKSGLYIGSQHTIDHSFWHRAYFNNFGTTIGGGTSQIQANIIAERCLGLSKD